MTRCADARRALDADGRVLAVSFRPIGLIAVVASLGCGRVADAPSTRLDAGRDAPHDAYMADGFLADTGRDVAPGIDASGPHCTIDSVFVPAGKTMSPSSCQACDPTVSTSSWTVLPNGAACSNGQTCENGVCIGCPSSCVTDQDCGPDCFSDAGIKACCSDAPTPTCYGVREGQQCPDEIPPTCGSPCTSDSMCQSLCTAPTGGTIVCCDQKVSFCTPFPQTSCPGTITCGSFCESDSPCASLCPATNPGWSNCCFLPTNRCYVAPVPECPG